jgi:hypothetical protein
MFITIPSHVVRQIQVLGHEQTAYMCFGVKGRGDKDETDWDEDKEESDDEEHSHSNLNGTAGWAPLSDFLEVNVLGRKK